MARKKIREYDAKRLIAKNIDLGLEVKGILIDQTTDLNSLDFSSLPWLAQPLVVKPDQLFGQRGKHGLVLVNANLEQTKSFIKENLNKEIVIGKIKDRLTHFLIEPFIPHDKEYYLSFLSERDGDVIYFSEEGGVNVEDNWSKMKKIIVPTTGTANFQEITAENIKTFVISLYEVFKKLDFTYLEINPFTIKDEKIYLLDTVAILDSNAYFLQQKTWNNLPFPKPFGKKSFAEEDYIEQLDENSGASLKLTVLNPQGRIWNILGGGGASVIYLDMIANLGKGEDIGNYGENSGNPSTQESYEYAKTIIELMLKGNGKILFIAGGIANFTDIKNTFIGIIRALEEYGQSLKQNNISIYVRRGGPNWEQGLKLMKNVGEKLDIPMIVRGPETSMPEIIEIAKDKLTRL